MSYTKSPSLIRFPFLGTREDGEPFQYMLMSISQTMANIAIFAWFSNQIALSLNEKVDLFIPSLLTLKYDFRNDISGIIISSQKEKELDGKFYEVSFHNQPKIHLEQAETPEEFSQTIPTELSLLDMFFRLMKDTLIIKEGILIYLKHLMSYFSRIINYTPKEYSDLKKFIFVDIEDKIKKNQKAIRNIYDLLKNTVKDIKDITLEFNLEDLREAMESELNLDLLMLVCGDVTSREELVSLLYTPKSHEPYNMNYKYINYIIAIKNLEKRLYSNYNQIVLIYLKAI